MKQVTLFILTFLLVLNTFAEKIDKEQASQIAQNFWSLQVLNNGEISSIIPITYNNQVVYFQINMASEGWILISATKSAIPVLAYATIGKMQHDKLPLNTASWLNQYQQKISEIIEKNLPVSNQIQQQWITLESSISHNPSREKARGVEPLLTSTWNQSRYYNDLCPADPAGPGGHCYAGCVPSAMGQICNYFRWPDTGLGVYSYDDPQYGTLSANFGNTTYRWDEMATELNTTNFEVAQLLYHLGVSCDLVYGPDGSGMYNHKAAYALKTHFKYDQETQYVYRDSTTMDWDSLLISHLDQRIPLYYAGWSVPDIVGHAFVCDGYQEGHYYHFNWGWGGSSDGYFYTDALNPGGSNFNLAQELIINAVPDTNLYSYPTGCSGYNELATTCGTIDDGSGPWHDYLSDTQCSWLIAPEDSVSSINLHFIQFDVNAADTVYLYAGANAEAPLLGAYSGNEIPEELTVESDHVFVEFLTQSTTGNNGWLLEFEAQIPTYCTSNESLTDISGTLNDGSGPRNYHNASACMWMIAPAGAQEIALQFESFETESIHDVVTVYDGNTILGEFTGNELPPVLTATSGYMFIVFTTNFEITAPGWSASYTTDLVQTEEHFKDEATLKIYPNPANTALTITRYKNQKSAYYSLINNLGVEVLSETSESDQVVWNIEHLNPGIYYVKCQTEDETQIVKLLVQ